MWLGRAAIVEDTGLPVSYRNQCRKVPCLFRMVHDTIRSGVHGPRISRSPNGRHIGMGHDLAGRLKCSGTLNEKKRTGSSKERRVRKDGVSKCRSRWSPSLSKTK